MKNKNTNNFVIFGKQPVFLCLKNKKREIYKIVTSNKNELLSFIETNKIKIQNHIIEEKNNNEISKLFDKEVVNHQGYVLYVGNRATVNFDIFLTNICKSNKNQLPKLLILDEITDPHNVGAIIRTAAAFGIKYIITSIKNSAKDSSTIIKTSAGYTELIELIEVTNINQTILDLKKVGYFVYGLDGNTKNDIKTIKDKNNLCLVLGNEGKGIRQLVKKNCDDLYKINMDDNIESLNVSVAAAIAIYQIWG